MSSRRHGRQRPKPGQAAAKWTAGQAAFKAVQLRDEVLARFPDIPYRELRRAELPPRPTDPVRVTQLRSFSELGRAEQDHHREYRHRWIVRMHKVRQWYPSQGVHKVIWRGPYIKGPADAPLLTGERVNALVR
jgi:hypothetical protein